MDKVKQTNRKGKGTYTLEFKLEAVRIGWS
jgi:hypothetical protein